VIATVRHEREPAAIRRPLQVAVLAAIEKQPLGLALTLERRGPDMIVLGVGELSARRNRRGVAFGNFSGSLH
jgi:hypothetical protein